MGHKSASGQSSLPLVIESTSLVTGSTTVGSLTRLKAADRAHAMSKRMVRTTIGSKNWAADMPTIRMPSSMWIAC